MTILRPGQRILNLPGIGVTTSRRAVSAGGVTGWWTVAGKTTVAAYQPVGAASYAASKVNLANPGTYDAINGSVYPTWDATGWIFDHQYLNTQYVPDGTTQAKTLGVRFSDLDTTYQRIMAGCHGSSQRFEMSNTVLGARFYGNGGYANGSATATSGVMFVTGSVGYYNGSSDASSISFSSETLLSLYIGARNLQGVGMHEPLFYGKIQAVVLYSDTLTAGEVAIVSSAMAAL